MPPVSWMHRLAMTSFTFMLEWVPEPVWNTCSGNSLSSSPRMISSQARWMSWPIQGGIRPDRVFTRAAAFFT